MHKGGAFSSPVCVPESTRPCLTLRCGLLRSSLPRVRAGKKTRASYCARPRETRLAPLGAVARKRERLCCCPRADKEHTRRRAQKRGIARRPPTRKAGGNCHLLSAFRATFCDFFGALPEEICPTRLRVPHKAKCTEKRFSTTVFHRKQKREKASLHRVKSECRKVIDRSFPQEDGVFHRVFNRKHDVSCPEISFDFSMSFVRLSRRTAVGSARAAAGTGGRTPRGGVPVGSAGGTFSVAAQECRAPAARFATRILLPSPHPCGTPHRPVFPFSCPPPDSSSAPRPVDFPCTGTARFPRAACRPRLPFSSCFLPHHPERGSRAREPRSSPPVPGILCPRPRRKLPPVSVPHCLAESFREPAAPAASRRGSRFLTARRSLGVACPAAAAAGQRREDRRLFSCCHPQMAFVTHALRVWVTNAAAPERGQNSARPLQNAVRGDII